MSLTFKEVDQIMRIVEEFDASEIRFEYGDLKLHVVRSGEHAHTGSGAPGPGRPAAAVKPVSSPLKVATAHAASSPPAVSAAPTTAMTAMSSDAPEPEGCISVNAPMMGVFYAAPAPDAPPFVVVGQKVDENTDLCIVEVMKVMNNIKAPCRGTIEQIVPQNASMVELGSPMFWIRPE